MRLERRRPWLWEATVLLMQPPGQPEPAELVTVRGVTRKQAQVRATRFMSVREHAVH